MTKVLTTDSLVSVRMMICDEGLYAKLAVQSLALPKVCQSLVPGSIEMCGVGWIVSNVGKDVVHYAA